MDDLEDQSVDMVVSSPPYYSLKEYAAWKTYEDYLFFIGKVANECYRVVKPGGWVCWNVQDSIPFPPSETGKERYSKPLAGDSIRLFMDAGFQYEKGVIWYKGQGTATQRLFGTYPNPGLILISGLTEHILLFRKWRGDYKREVTDETREKSLLTKEEWSKWALDLWEIQPESAKRIGHPAPFPVEIPKRLIRMFSFHGDIILDPFFGSGSTGIAAHMCGRKYVGYEIHSEYIDLARNRLKHNVDIFGD